MNPDRIFVIDDDQFFSKYFRKSLESLLNERAVEVHAFYDVESALKVSGEIQPSLIFLDHYFAGQSGLDALPEMKKCFPNAEIILLSATVDDDLPRKAIENGADFYIQKDSSTIENISKIFIGMDGPRSGSETWKRLFKNVGKP